MLWPPEKEFFLMIMHWSIYYAITNRSELFFGRDLSFYFPFPADCPCKNAASGVSVELQAAWYGHC